MCRHAVLASLLAAAAPAGAQPTDPSSTTTYPSSTTTYGPDSDDTIALVPFSAGSARVSEHAHEQLGRLRAWQRQHPGQLLIIDGRASRTGSASGNLRLSQRRTEAVRQALIREGIDPARLVLVARQDRGSSGPRDGVVIRATAGIGSAPQVASASERPRAAARSSAVTGAPRTRSSGTTVVIVPGSGGATAEPVHSSGRGLPPSGTSAGNSGVPGRTSGGVGGSALTGIGVDPTDTTDWGPANAGAEGGAVVSGGIATGGGTAMNGAAPGAGAAAPGGAGSTGAAAGTSGAVGAGVTGAGVGPTNTGTGASTAATGTAAGAGSSPATGTTSTAAGSTGGTTGGMTGAGAFGGAAGGATSGGR